MRNANIASRARNRGFALNELLLTVAIVSVLVGIGAAVYSGLRDGVGAEEQAQRMVDMAADVRRYMGKAQGNYTGLTPARANALGLLKPPLRWDGASIRDRWGNSMDLYGQGPWLFSVTAGGATSMSPTDCAALAIKLASSAYAVMIGTSTVITKSGASDGWVTGGLSYKTGLVLSQGNLTTGCAQATPVVGATFLER
jgi:prepilin-type N-terminal cleavage/methylation domain-containing protein